MIRPWLFPRAPLHRFRVRNDLAVAGILLLTVGLYWGPACQAQFMAGADISALSVLEDGGATYADGGPATDAVQIFTENGVNWFRLRLFVNPENDSDDFVVNDIDYTLDLAKRAKAAGANVLLDFHYSDTWADPGKQFKPAAWESLNFSQLEQRVYDYTKDVLETFEAEDVLPEMVQIGNEIANGMLWEDGQLWRSGVSENTEFDNLAALLSAGINGARDGSSSGNGPRIMIHHDQGGDWGATSYYFDRLLPRLQSNGTDIDVIGYSYYPKWHYSPWSGEGDIDDVEENLNNTASTYGKSVAIVEAGFASRGAQFEPDYEFEVSPEGQQEYLQALVDAVQNVPDNKGEGVFWWYAEAVPVFGLSVWEGGRYGLFDENGELLPAIDVFANLDQSSGVPGDYNNDGTVDAADYTVWLNNLGGSNILPNDPTPELVDHSDYATWKANFGQMATANSARGSLLAEVPEPGSLTLLAGLVPLMGLGLARCRRAS